MLYGKDSTAKVLDGKHLTAKIPVTNPNTQTIVDPSQVDPPLSSVGMDIFHVNNQNWLVMVDRSTGSPFAAKLPSLSTSAVTNQLQSWFRDLGAPTVIRSDNGPQFRSDFSDFCSSRNIKHETSSPYNPGQTVWWKVLSRISSIFS